MVNCKKCGRGYRRESCEYCKREERWEEKKHIDIFPPRIRRDLLSIDITIDQEELAHVRSGNGLFLVGPSGCGKTLYASKLMLEAIHLGFVEHEGPTKFGFMCVPDYLDEIRKSYMDNEPEATDFTDIGFLLVDDLGAEKVSDWVVEKLYQMINHRYEHLMCTVFTSNLSGEELADRLGDRVAGRINQMCKIKTMEDIDYRT